MGREFSLAQASDAVGEIGWRVVLGNLCTTVPVGSLADGAAVVTRAVAVAGGDAPLGVDLRAGRVVLTLRGPAAVDVARRISAELPTRPGHVQALEIAIDALDIAAVRPFWRAVLAYVDDGGSLVDPLEQGPPLWFQQMDAPRPQRNRIHIDVSVPHDEAGARIAAAVAAGGRVLSDHRAPSFWVLADAEGNEACVSTWQGRD
nr:VOC family protein [uncultured Actinoplanes sp.]